MFVLPLNRDNPVKNIPWVVVGLILVNTAMLVITYSSSSPADFLFKAYGFTPLRHQPYTLITSLFLHAGFWHLFGNMWFLWMFGNRVENTLGPWLFGPVFMACGLGGALFHYLFNSTSAIPCVGASGAISGIVGCFFVLFPKAKFDLAIYLGWAKVKTFHTHTTAAVGAWIAEQALLGVLTQAISASSVAFMAHVGGFGVGLAVGGMTLLVIPREKLRALDRAKPWFLQDWINREERSGITQLKL